jgi:hypothetical protein
MRLLSDEMRHIIEHLQRGAHLIGPVTVSLIHSTARAAPSRESGFVR